MQSEKVPLTGGEGRDRQEDLEAGAVTRRRAIVRWEAVLTINPKAAAIAVRGEDLVVRLLARPELFGACFPPRDGDYLVTYDDGSEDLLSPSELERARAGGAPK
jgi:hypothetical protein